MAWARLIRFVDTKGVTSFGEPCVEHAEDLIKSLASQTLFALKLEGSDPFALSAPGEKVQVQSILEVLKPTDVPIIKCIGLNYMKHSK
ncbi:MAG: hypothetical protein CL912_27360 [Deltaproteobacteria bacterium]|nr:hypothetical protein [Deltaproteobacteria bacterium]|tara:strand:+ start:320 stop:583 length:264 start_codon:yes stop_codon:yes gene_type:complete